MGVQRDEVSAALQKLNLGKAAGSDGISAELLRGCGSVVVAWLLELMEGLEDWSSSAGLEGCRTSTVVQERGQNEVRQLPWDLSLSVPGKVLSLILLERLKKIIEPQLQEAQCGFREGRGTTDQIWAVRQLVEKSLEHHSELCLCFIDLSKAYDSMNRKLSFDGSTAEVWGPGTHSEPR